RKIAAVANVQITVVPEREPKRLTELGRVGRAIVAGVTLDAGPGDRVNRAVDIEPADHMIEGIGNVEIPLGVELERGRPVQRGLGRAPAIARVRSLTSPGDGLDHAIFDLA